MWCCSCEAAAATRVGTLRVHLPAPHRLLTSCPFAVLLQQLGCRLPEGVLQRVVPRGACLPPAVELRQQPCQVPSPIPLLLAAAVAIVI